MTLNRDDATIRGFGEEWSAYDQSKLQGVEFERQFDGYFRIFPFDSLPRDAEGFDMGCGSGRWAAAIAPRVGKLHCIDPSDAALGVARRNLAGLHNVEFHEAGVDDIPLADASQDFGYAVGVLHHIPDTEAALRSCTAKLKPGAPFLVYLYYRFDNRPRWYSGLWRSTDWLRGAIARRPFGVRKAVTQVIAAAVYWPLARTAGLLERAGANVSNVPLSAYRYRSFYSMRTDALDRFGTRLERRFTRDEIRQMMERCGLTGITFSDREPFWVACGRRG